ncbi:unnamed protein product [Camellia sinensis]
MVFQYQENTGPSRVKPVRVLVVLRGQSSHGIAREGVGEYFKKPLKDQNRGSPSTTNAL